MLLAKWMRVPCCICYLLLFFIVVLYRVIDRCSRQTANDGGNSCERAALPVPDLEKDRSYLGQ